MFLIFFGCTVHHNDTARKDLSLFKLVAGNAVYRVQNIMVAITPPDRRLKLRIAGQLALPLLHSTYS